MKPYYGAMNDQNQWFDGTDWKAMKGNASVLISFQTLREHDASNCHVDGVFKALAREGYQRSTESIRGHLDAIKRREAEASENLI